MRVTIFLLKCLKLCFDMGLTFSLEVREMLEVKFLKMVSRKKIQFYIKNLTLCLTISIPLARAFHAYCVH